MKKIILMAILALAAGIPTETKAQSTFQLQSQTSPDQAEYNFIVDDWELKDYEDFLKKYPNSPYASEIRARVSELKLWNNAKGINTLDSYQNYLNSSKFGRFNRQAVSAMAQLEELAVEQAWNAACITNTIAAYENFIQNNPDAPQVAQARNRINVLKVDKAWEELKNTESAEEIEIFISQNPDFDRIDYAKSRYHALKMSDYFDQNLIDMASKELDLISDTTAIPESGQFAYNIVNEYNRFKKLSPSSSESDLMSFLRTYPTSSYQGEVRNYVALSKASKFNTSSTKEDYDMALSYATGKTREAVLAAQKANDKNISYQKALERKQRRNWNGGWMGLVIEYLDASWNGRTEAGLFRYDFGIKFRVGNYADRVQFAVGVKPGVGVWDFKGNLEVDEYGYEKEKSSAFFEMPIEAELKLNLCKTGYSTWMYLDGRFDYNVIREKKVQRPMGFRAGLGWGGHSWDFVMYYGMELGDIDKEFDPYLPSGILNPFVDKKTAMFFGISLGATVKLF